MFPDGSKSWIEIGGQQSGPSQGADAPEWNTVSPQHAINSQPLPSKPNLGQRFTAYVNRAIGEVRTRGLFGAATSGGAFAGMSALAVSPLMTTGSVGTKVLGEVKAGTSAGLNWAKRQITNPFAGVTMKQGLQAWGKKIAGGTLMGVGVASAEALAEAALSENANVGQLLKRNVLLGMSQAVNPLGTVFGVGNALVNKIVRGGKNVVDNIPTPSLPTVPTINPTDILNAVDDKLKDFSADFSGMSIPSVEVGGASYAAPSFSFSAGGGPSFDPSMLLLLAGGAGLLGYGLGRRKKRRKSKRRKRK